MKIRWKLILAVLAIQLIVGVIDAMSVLHCHTTVGSECWPWFSIFTINLPASVLPALLVSVADAYLSFYPQWMLSAFSYVFVGTLWWSSILHLAFWLYAKANAKMKQENA